MVADVKGQETVLHKLGFIYASKQQHHNDSTAKLHSFILFMKSLDLLQYDINVQRLSDPG